MQSRSVAVIHIFPDRTPLNLELKNFLPSSHHSDTRRLRVPGVLDVKRSRWEGSLFWSLVSYGPRRLKTYIGSCEKAVEIMWNLQVSFLFLQKLGCARQHLTTPTKKMQLCKKIEAGKGPFERTETETNSSAITQLLKTVMISHVHIQRKRNPRKQWACRSEGVVSERSFGTGPKGCRMLQRSAAQHSILLGQKCSAAFCSTKTSRHWEITLSSPYTPLIKTMCFAFISHGRPKID